MLGSTPGSALDAIAGHTDHLTLRLKHAHHLVLILGHHLRDGGGVGGGVRVRVRVRVRGEGEG